MTTTLPTEVGSALADLGTAFCNSRILFSALEMNVFTELQDGELTAEDLTGRLGLHPRGAQHFLSALSVLGLLEQTPAGGYRNSPAAASHLVRGPDYQGGFLEGAGHVLYPAWGGLTDALRTGAPQAVGDLEEMLSDPQRRRGYLAMMDSLSAPLAPAVAAALTWPRFTTVLDVGGARGNLMGLLLQRFGELRATVLDRPQNESACHEHRTILGVADRLTFRGGDFFTDTWPNADVVVIGHVLADFSPDQRRQLIARAFAALPPGGALVVYDPMPDPVTPEMTSLVAGLHMLVMTPHGSGYAPDECRAWLEQAGFVDVSVMPAVLGNSVVVGRRPN